MLRSVAVVSGGVLVVSVAAGALGVSRGGPSEADPTPGHSSSSAPVPSDSPVALPAPADRGSAPGRPAPYETNRADAPGPSGQTTPAGGSGPSGSSGAGHGASLPLRQPTGSAQQVITVLARSSGSTEATVQAWTAVRGGWQRHGAAVTAFVGAQGLTTHPSESRSATPIGSFTLTTAFGHYADPGTRLPYLHTTPSDWWISEPGRLYNTHQRCSSGCAFATGAPNEHLYYETPAYNYAVVIDYNTANAGTVVQGAGSAFFLHVSDGSPTAGCVSIPQASLIQNMQWLDPAKHPRILIGVG